MTTPILTADEADDLRDLLESTAKRRCTAAKWEQVCAALMRLRDALACAPDREVLDAIHAIEAVAAPRRVRSEPGPMPLETVPDAVAHLIHEVELALHNREEEATLDGAGPAN